MNLGPFAGFIWASYGLAALVIGGLIGIALGWTISTGLSFFAGWATSVSPQSVLLAFFFSAFIGIVFGIYPAKKASELHPIDALRYE